MSALFLSSTLYAPIRHEQAQQPPHGIPEHLLPGGRACPGCEPETIRDWAAE